METRRWITREDSEEPDSQAKSGGDFFEEFPADREAFLRICRSEVYPKRAFPFFQGDRDQKVFYIQTGLVKIIRVTPCGREAIVSLRYPGQLFGLAEAMGGDARRASAQAVRKTHVQLTGGARSKEFLKNHPLVAVRVGEVLSRRLRDLCQQIESLMVCDPVSRLIKLLLTLAEQGGAGAGETIRVPLGLSQSELAAMIGSSRQTVNHILRGLEAENLIRASQAEITIVRCDALVARWAAGHKDPLCCAACVVPAPPHSLLPGSI